MYREIQAKTALNRLKRRIPYGWDLNIYRGCEHNCQYCYARYSHKYLSSEDFSGDIFVKINIEKFAKTNTSTGLHVMPILPFITDNEDNFEEMFASARDCSVNYVLTGTLYLRKNTRNHFFEFIKKEFPNLHERYLQLYKTGGAGKGYKTKLYEIVNRLREKYNLSSSYMKPMREKLRINN